MRRGIEYADKSVVKACEIEANNFNFAELKDAFRAKELTPT